MVIQERRTRVAEQWMRGIPQYRIAQVEGVDRPTVCRDLEKIRQDWKEQRAASYDVRLDEEVARINRLERIATEAWERSCLTAEVRKAEVVKGRVNKDGAPLPDIQRTSKVEHSQVGDPRFLERIAWCIETRLKLLGNLQGVVDLDKIMESWRAVLEAVRANVVDPVLLKTITADVLRFMPPPVTMLAASSNGHVGDMPALPMSIEPTEKE